MEATKPGDLDSRLASRSTPPKAQQPSPPRPTSKQPPQSLYSQLPAAYVPRQSPTIASPHTSDTETRDVNDISEVDTSVNSDNSRRGYVMAQNNVSVMRMLPVPAQPLTNKASRPDVLRSATSTASATTTNATTSNTSPQGSLMETAAMFNLLNIKFDRSLQQAESITAIGDSHLGKLEVACRNLLQQISAARKNKKDKDVPQSPTAASLPSYTEVALAYTEVLQLQNRPKEAVIVLSKAIEKLNADLAQAKHHRSLTSTMHSESTAGSSASGFTAEEYEHLKKVRTNCQRRIGSLYKATGKYKDAEEHVKKYISRLERQTSTPTVKREKANAYSLLASIYDLTGKSEEAMAADQKALELATS